MDLRLIKTFVTAYEEESFSRAAARLNATQPGVSNQIALLEQRLDVALFERKGRGVTPTIAGRRFYAHASKIIRDIHLAEQEIRALSGSITGELAFGIPPTLSRAVLAPVLSQYVAAYPDVEIRIFEAYSDTLLAHVETGELDVAIVAQLLDHPAIEYHDVYRDRFVVVSGTHLGLEPHAPVSLNSEPYFKLVVPSLLRHGLKRLLEEPLRTGRIVPTRVIEIDGLSGALEFLTISDWIALLPAATAYQAPEDKLQFNPIAGEDIVIDYFVAHTRTKPLSPAAQAIVSLVTTELDRVAADWQVRLSLP